MVRQVEREDGCLIFDDILQERKSEPMRIK
jgi:hypothetical protein